jgi:hypothetical protein
MQLTYDWVMGLRCAIGNLTAEAHDLLMRLRSDYETQTIIDTDLHILRVQLSLLDIQLGNMQEIRRLNLPVEEQTN